MTRLAAIRSFWLVEASFSSVTFVCILRVLMLSSLCNADRVAVSLLKIKMWALYVGFVYVIR